MTDSNYEPKILALAAHLSVDPSTITKESSDCSSWDDLYSSHEAPGEYSVMTDAEADEACLSSYDWCEYEEQIDGERYYIYRVG